MNRKHSPNHDSLLFYVLIAAQVELGLQLACRLCRERSEDAEKGTQSKEKEFDVHAV